MLKIVAKTPRISLNSSYLHIWKESLDFRTRLGGKFHPGIYRWHLPVFTGLENTPQVANTGKYWQIELFLP